MNPMERMEAKKPYFSPNDQKIYEIILKTPRLVIELTSSELAARCNVSQPALSRFVKSLEYRRYADFRAQMLDCVSKRPDAPAGKQESSALLTALFKLDMKEQLHQIGEIARIIKTSHHVFACADPDLFPAVVTLERSARKKGLNIQPLPCDDLGFSRCFFAKEDFLLYFTSQDIPFFDDISCPVVCITDHPEADIEVNCLSVPVLAEDNNVLSFFLIISLLLEKL